MRTEVRFEKDEHEFSVTIEADQSVDFDTAIQAAIAAFGIITGNGSDGEEFDESELLARAILENSRIVDDRVPSWEAAGKTVRTTYLKLARRLIVQGWRKQ